MMRDTPVARFLSVVRMAAGPLALLAFLLPWTHGPGALAGESYTGLDLVRLARVLQGLHLPAAQSATLVAARVRNAGCRGAICADYCLGDPVLLVEVVERVVADLADEAVAAKYPLARDAVYDTLRAHYPCRIAD